MALRYPFFTARGIQMIAPHRRGRTRTKTQDGRPLRRYRRRWKIKRFIAWVGAFRRLVVRYERYVLNYLGFVYLRREMTCRHLVIGCRVSTPYPPSPIGIVQHPVVQCVWCEVQE